MTQKYYLSTFMKAVSIYAALAFAIKTKLEETKEKNESTKAKLEAEDYAGFQRTIYLETFFTQQP